MRIKRIPLPKGTTISGISSGRITCAPGKQHNGVHVVTMPVEVFDVYDLPYVVLNVTLTKDEARKLGEALVKHSEGP